MNDTCWLPKLECFDNYKNDWTLYEAALYNIFRKDFIDSKPSYKNIEVNIKHYPIKFDKEEAFLSALKELNRLLN